MTTFILASRRAGRRSSSSLARARTLTDRTFGSMFMSSVDIIADADPADELGRRMVRFEADPEEVARKSLELPGDVIVEPAIEHNRLHTLPPLDLMHGARFSPGDCGHGDRIDVFAHWDGTPLPQTMITACFRGPTGSPPRSFDIFTGASGKVAVIFDSGVWHLAALIVTPYCGHWPMLLRGPLGRSVDIACAPLPPPGPGWWQARMRGGPTLGRGVRIGVVDTGCGSHPDLDHVKDVGAFIGGLHLPNAGADVDSHGTHVCGSISAWPARNSHHFDGYSGLSAGVGLFSARVFSDSSSSAMQDDIAAAIDELSIRHSVDLINLSLGASAASQLEHDAILDALDKGALCICAAGNGAPASPSVLYPAAFAETVAVSALGLDGWAPAGTMAASRLPAQHELFGQNGLFLANFSCFGPEISVAAPGVGIVAPVPARHGFTHPYAAMDGTSMAAPLACAALSASLSADSSYLNLPRGRVRSEKARQLLIDNAQNIGLLGRYQGRGLARA